MQVEDSEQLRLWQFKEYGDKYKANILDSLMGLDKLKV
jgi:hypothetical protein